jgi:hypothetical protein
MLLVSPEGLIIESDSSLHIARRHAANFQEVTKPGKRLIKMHDECGEACMKQSAQISNCL